MSDSLGFRALLAHLLETAGWRVVEARRDRDGVSTVAAAAPQLVVLDALGDADVAERFLVRLCELAPPLAPTVVVLADGAFDDPSGLVVARLDWSFPNSLERILKVVADDLAPPNVH